MDNPYTTPSLETLLDTVGAVLIAEGAIVANLCYFAGPIIETYVRWLGYDRKWVRWFLFVGGTVLTGMLAIATMAFMFLPDQDKTGMTHNQAVT